MAKLSKLDYETLKSLDPADLDQEMLNAIHEYESSEAGVPTKEEMDYATSILNERNPLIQKAYRDNGDFDKANKIISQSRAAKELMIKQGKDPYVKQVKQVPDDINNEYGFKFNWKSAYENSTGEKLRPTENDAKKLEKFVGDNLYAIDDPVKLQKIAYDMHLYNPNTMTWGEFLKSENGKEFQNYLQDVQKAQKDKALKDIWEGDEPTQQWTPFGYKEVPGAKAAVDFMLPVSKEYARKNYENINGVGDMVKPISTDALANAAMLLGGESKAATLAGNIASPIISNAGQYALNDMPLEESVAGGLLGAGVNVYTPRVVNKFANVANEASKGKVGNLAQTKINEAATRASKIQRKIDEGVPFQLIENTFLSKGKGKKPDIIYTNNPNAKFGTINFGKGAKKDVVVKPLSDLNEAVPGPMDEGLDAFPKWAMRKNLFDNNTRWNDIIRDIETRNNPKLKQELDAKVVNALNSGNPNELVRTLDKMSAGELMLLGKANKETKANFIKRKIDEYAGLTKNYGMNMLGRDKYANPILRNVDNIFGTDLTSPDKKPDSNKLIKLYGLDQD